MSQIEIAEAETKLRELIERACTGEDVVLTEQGQERARLVAGLPDQAVRQPVQLGRLEGQFRIPDDFDAPLPDDLLDLFEGKT